MASKSLLLQELIASLQEVNHSPGFKHKEKLSDIISTLKEFQKNNPDLKPYKVASYLVSILITIPDIDSPDLHSERLRFLKQAFTDADFTENGIELSSSSRKILFPESPELSDQPKPKKY